MSSTEKDDEELTIPRAAMNKLIKELVPDIRVANESRELILQCCSEFIRLITNEANAICEEQQKKTMSAEHVFEALEKLGLSAYRSEAEMVATDCKGKRRRQSTRLEHLGIPEEELLRQQQELFAKAKEEQARVEQEEWMAMQSAAMAQAQSSFPSSVNNNNNLSSAATTFSTAGSNNRGDDDDYET